MYVLSCLQSDKLDVSRLEFPKTISFRNWRVSEATTTREFSTMKSYVFLNRCGWKRPHRRDVLVPDDVVKKSSSDEVVDQMLSNWIVDDVVAHNLRPQVRDDRTQDVRVIVSASSWIRDRGQTKPRTPHTPPFSQEKRPSLSLSASLLLLLSPLRHYAASWLRQRHFSYWWTPRLSWLQDGPSAYSWISVHSSVWKFSHSFLSWW